MTARQVDVTLSLTATASAALSALAVFGLLIAFYATAAW
jgi:hypothetical protein